MDWIFPILSTVLVLACLSIVHYNGYKQGHKDGFELGREKINEYALKINRAQGERIKKLQEEKNQGRADEIKRLSDFLTKNIEK